MSLPVEFDPDAEADLDALEEYLALRFSRRNAELYVERIVSACNSLGQSPNRGTMRGDKRSGTRTIGFEKRVNIVFEVSESRVLILSIFYAGRQSLR